MLIRLVHRLAAGVLVAACLAANPALAGDYGEPLPWKSQAPRDGYPVPQGPPTGYDQGGSYKDDPAPPPPPRAEPRRRVVAECLSKYGIREALNRQGWYEFANVEMRGELAYMVARNDRGRPFDLTFDSCSGDVVDAIPRVVRADAPIYYERYYEPRPAFGVYVGGGRYGGHGWGRRHW